MEKFTFGKLLLLVIWGICGTFMLITKSADILWFPAVATLLWAIAQ